MFLHAGGRNTVSLFVFSLPEIDHAWAEDLLRDFFQSTLGINLSVTLLNPTECLRATILRDGHVLGQITSICPPTDRHPPLDWLHNRCGGPQAHSKGI